MKLFTHRPCILVLAAVCFIFAATNAVRADDEAAAFADFHKAVLAANPGRVKQEFLQTHVHPPTEPEANEMAANIARAAIEVMDQSKAFEKRFPDSVRLKEMEHSLLDTLGYDFGSMNFPIPKNRAMDVEACARQLQKQFPDDVRPWIILIRVAARLPVPQGHALYEELSREGTPEPAHSMARIGLRALGRLGAPLDLSFTAVDGREVRLSDDKGKVVLINFWSTGCVPCVREMPDLKRLSGLYHAQGLELIGVSLDSNKAALEKFIQAQGISWPQFYDPSGPENRLAREFEIGSLPVLWLVDRHGNLCDMDARENLEAKIKTLLAEP